LGILAHVDAGKTTLTERLLYAAGVIDEIGSVDDGSTQTDSLALERQRGITIKSAVVSFVIDDVTVNLIDTPGHPDFIAEVERVLNVLDGAVLVVSAVEGVQSQTRILMRTLQRLDIPTLIFVNKIDRGGADPDGVVQAIAEKLTSAIVPVGSVEDAGTRRAAFVLDTRTSTIGAGMHPVFFGSAVTGAGVDSLMTGIAESLPAQQGDGDGPVSAVVFKVDRGSKGERIAYVRMFSGTLRTRDRVDDHGKVTAIRVFDHGGAVERRTISARQIGQLFGLRDIRIGDVIGDVPAASRSPHQFAPPTLETVVAPVRADDRGALRVALDQLAEQDPLINVRQDDIRHEITVSLYGEVQKEVIRATLAGDFGLDVVFHGTTTICIERLVASGRAVEVLQSESHPFSATIEFRVEPAALESGVQVRVEIDPRSMPLHIYKTKDRFVEAMTQYVLSTLDEGLFGWPVTDCKITMTDCGYYASDGPTKPVSPTPRTTAADFRKLTPLVLMLAIKRAKTVVCEPITWVRIEVPSDALGPVIAAVSGLGDVVGTTATSAGMSMIDARLPAAHTQVLRRQLPGLTGGEGTIESDFAGYLPVRPPPPKRTRRTVDPLDRPTYLAHVARRPSSQTRTDT
jgi:ribosomal protection tetracycline resistance protein